MPAKLTVRVGINCKPAWPGASMLTATFMLVTGALALGPPRLAILQMTRLVLINPAIGGSQVTGSAPVDGLVSTLRIVIRVSRVMASRTFFAFIPPVSCTVQVSVPCWKGFRLVGAPLAEIDRETTWEPGGGGVPGGVVVRCSCLKVTEWPAESCAVAVEVIVIWAFCIWTTMSILVTAPGASTPRPQATMVVLVPPAVQNP